MGRICIGPAVFALSIIAAPALAAPPPVLDRLPSDAAFVVALRSIDTVHTRIMSLASTFGVDDVDLGPIDDLIEAGALDMSGSAGLALSFPGGDPTAGEPSALALVPVGDYDLFLKAIGAEREGKFAHAILDEGGEAYFRKLDDGYVAAASDIATLEGFEDGGGHAAAHGRRLGKTGRNIADESDLLVILDVEPFAPMILAGAQQMLAQMAMAGAMMGQADQGQAELISSLAEALAEQGQAIVFGGAGGEAGLRFDAGVQFKEGTTWAGYLSEGGNAGELLSRVPAQPFLYAFAMDFSTPGLKALVKQFIPEDANPVGNLGAGFLAGLMDQVDGEAVVMGSSPAGMMGGGLFLNTVTYYSGSNPDELSKALAESITALDGQEFPGMKIAASHAPSAAEPVGDASLEEWSIAMQMNPQQAGQMGMMMMMMFGPTGGPSGYMAKTEGGVVMTMSKNRNLASKAIEAANAGDGGFRTDEGVRAVAASLPEDRFLEGYVGVKEVGRMVTAFLPMVLGRPVNVQVPEDVPPLGMSGVTREGGVRLSLFAPTPVIEFTSRLTTTLRDLGAQAPGENNDAGRPRF